MMAGAGAEGEEGEEPPPPEEENGDVAFVGAALEESFAESTLMDLLFSPSPRPPDRERDLDDVYDRMDKLETGINFLVTVNPENKCVMHGDIRKKLQKVNERLDELDATESKLKVGPFKLTFKWGGLIAAIVVLAKIKWQDLLMFVLAIF